MEEARGSLEQPCLQTLGLTLEKLPGAPQLSDQLVASQVSFSFSLIPLLSYCYLCLSSNDHLLCMQHRSDVFSVPSG